VYLSIFDDWVIYLFVVEIENHLFYLFHLFRAYRGRDRVTSTTVGPVRIGDRKNRPPTAGYPKRTLVPYLVMVGSNQLQAL